MFGPTSIENFFSNISGLHFNLGSIAILKYFSFSTVKLLPTFRSYTQGGNLTTEFPAKS